MGGKLGLFNFKSKKTEASAQTEPVPEPPKEDELPPFTDAFSGSVDLNPKEEKPQTQDSSLLEISGDENKSPEALDFPPAPEDNLPDFDLTKDIEDLKEDPVEEKEPEDEPTEPLELDTPPVPEKLDLGDMNDIYTGLDDFSLPDVTGKDDSDIPLPPERPLPKLPERMETKPKIQLEKGLEKLQLKEEPKIEPARRAEPPRIERKPEPRPEPRRTEFTDENVFELRDAQEVPYKIEEKMPPEPISPEKHTHVVQASDGKRPLFLDLLTFMNIEKLFDSFTNETKLAEDTIYRLSDIHKQQDDQFNIWQEIWEDLEKKMVMIDKALFKI